MIHSGEERTNGIRCRFNPSIGINFQGAKMSSDTGILLLSEISGIIARAKPGWDDETLAPTINHCIDQFGENRIFFGGDWPVCTLGASLGEWIGSLSRIIASRPESLQRKLLHENAERVYRLN